MGIIYQVHEGLGTTFEAWCGMITATIFLAHANLMASDPRWPQPERRHMADLRSVSVDTSMDQETVEKAAAIYAQGRNRLAGLKLAIIAHTQFDKVTGFQAVLVRYGASVIVFNHTSAACKWLGIDTDAAEAVLYRLRDAAREKAA